jgi:hypothetical protein
MGKTNAHKLSNVFVISHYLRSIIIIIGILGLYYGYIESKPKTEDLNKHYLKYQYSISSDRPDYYLSSIKKWRGKSIAVDTILPIRWGVVSHHLLIKDLIAEYFLRLSKVVHPKTIVLIGPDHFSRSQFTMTISKLPWKTPFGLINPDNEIVRELLTSHIVKNDENAFYNEHSIGALVPFVKYYFPQAKIVTIIIRSDATNKDGQVLAEFISSLKSPDFLPIASLDFSHYKTSIVAQHEDSITIDILRHFDIGRYKDTFVDSHIALYTVMETCQKLHTFNLKIIHHTNSGIVTGKLTDPSTSYLNLLIW